MWWWGWKRQKANRWSAFRRSLWCWQFFKSFFPWKKISFAIEVVKIGSIWHTTKSPCAESFYQAGVCTQLQQFAKFYPGWILFSKYKRGPHKFLKPQKVIILAKKKMKKEKWALIKWCPVTAPSIVSVAFCSVPFPWCRMKCKQSSSPSWILTWLSIHQDLVFPPGWTISMYILLAKIWRSLEFLV